MRLFLTMLTFMFYIIQMTDQKRKQHDVTDITLANVRMLKMLLRMK